MPATVCIHCSPRTRLNATADSHVRRNHHRAQPCDIGDLLYLPHRRSWVELTERTDTGWRATVRGPAAEPLTGTDLMPISYLEISYLEAEVAVRPPTAAVFTHDLRPADQVYVWQARLESTGGRGWVMPRLIVALPGLLDPGCLTVTLTEEATLRLCRQASIRHRPLLQPALDALVARGNLQQLDDARLDTTLTPAAAAYRLTFPTSDNVL